MIKLEELLKNTKFETIPSEHQANLLKLLEKINKVREAYGKPLTVTSGYRSKEDQLRIYKAKGIPENKIPWGSAHLEGLACDISDPNGEFKNWIMQNIKLFEDLELYMEDFSTTVNWTHIQFRRPLSGARFFKP